MQVEVTRGDVNPSQVEVQVQVSLDSGAMNIPHPSNAFAQFSNASTSSSNVVYVTSPPLGSWYWITISLKSFNTTYNTCLCA